MSKSCLTIKLPPEIEHLRGPINGFIEAMVYKLAANAHKGAWPLIGVQNAMDMLEDERVELADAIQRGNAIEILLEAADVANFALILSNIAIQGLNDEHIVQGRAEPKPGVGPGCVNYASNDVFGDRTGEKTVGYGYEVGPAELRPKSVRSGSDSAQVDLPAYRETPDERSAVEPGADAKEPERS